MYTVSKKTLAITNEQWEQIKDKEEEDMVRRGDLLYFLKLWTNASVPEDDGGHYYVYGAYSDGLLVYIGSGKADRCKHASSGVSHNRRLNKLLFTGHEIDVTIISKGLSKEESITLEKQLIAFYNPEANVVSKTKMMYRSHGGSPFERISAMGLEKCYP